MQEWILRVAHGDHQGSEKIKELCDRFYWETKERGILKKAKQLYDMFPNWYEPKVYVTENRN